jgi:endonuclease/exonuclease/phosphatase family metal-dependent hydrolase
MSKLRGRFFTSRTITITAVILSLIVAALLSTLLTFPRALAATIVSDNFNDNSLDTTKWGTSLFSGFTNTSLGLNETSQQLQIGPLLQNTGGSNYRGVRTNSTYSFSNAYAFVELVQAPSSSTAADAMFTVGNDVDNYYRIYVSAGNLIGLKKIGGTKTTLFTTTYNSTNHRFLRIRNDSGAVTLDTATGSSGVPGTWTQQYTETWNSSISTSSIIFELKAGTWQSETNAPGTIIFDNFEAADNTAPAPTVSAISPTSGSTSGGTSVTITGTGFSSGAIVTLGGTSATGVTVVSSTSITATTPAHSAGTVNVVVTNTDTQSGTFTNGFTYSAPPSETVLISDNFNDNSLDTTKWGTTLFSGFTNTSLGLNETSNQLQIGPLLQNTGGSNYRGIRTNSTYGFSGGYAYVELVQAASSSTSGDAMFTLGNDVDNYYRIYVSAGNLIGLKKIAGTKTTLFTITYNSTNHRFLRISNDSGNVKFDTATGNSGVPGTWTQQYSETWNSSISTSSIIFELKAGTFQSETNAPGTVIFDNFHAATPGSTSPPTDSLTFVSANLQHGESTDGTTHYDSQANKITSTADLVAAQEVSSGDITNWDNAFEDGGFHRVVFRLNNTQQSDGNAIWARDSLSEIATYQHDLANGSSNVGNDNSTDIRRSVVAAKFEFNSQQFYVVSVHLCPSICRNSSSGTLESVQRVAQINDLLSWIDSTLTGSLPVIILGDLNLTTDTPKQPSGFQIDLFTSAGFSDLWATGISNSLAEANWGDRDGDSTPDMPLGLNTRTHDGRRIDYVLYKPNSGSIALNNISVPDGRAQCPTSLTPHSPYAFCSAVDSNQRINFPEDQGVRLSDHNWIWVELGF